MLSSTCQHVATLQFVSGAETVNSKPFPDLILVFYVEGEIAGLPQDSCKASPMAIFDERRG